MKLHFNLPLTLFILITNAVCLGTEYDLDEAGFIGCTRQELCGESGSYFATYSKEGLCTTKDYAQLANLKNILTNSMPVYFVALLDLLHLVESHHLLVAS